MSHFYHQVLFPTIWQKCWCHHFFNSNENADNMHPGDPTTGMVAGNYYDNVIKWKPLPRYWPFVREIHRSRWILRTKARDVELWCFLWSAPEWTVEWTIVMLMIWDAIGPIWRHWNNVHDQLTSLSPSDDIIGKDNDTHDRSVILVAEIKPFPKTYKYNFIFVHVDINNYRHKSVPLQEILRGRFVNLVIISESKLNNSFPNSNSQFNVEGYTVPDRTSLPQVEVLVLHRHMTKFECNWMWLYWHGTYLIAY